MASLIRIEVPSSLFAPSRREATLTVSPMTVYSSMLSEPMSPATSSPVCSPMRTIIGHSPSAMPARSFAMRSCISRLAATARTA